MATGDINELDLGQTIRGFAAGDKLFNRYTLKAILGRGGMGIVWRAFDEQLDRDVALKFLPELLVLDQAAMDELKRETKRSLELTHHHIVRIHDFAQDSRSACISMEYVDGKTLSALRVEKENKVFEVEELAPLIEQACDALEYAHTKAKIVHRDFKSSNLMLNSRGELKVTDFGIARSLSDSVSMHSVRTSGTLVYMSPQQLDGERAQPADDIYSLGASIYELLTSKPPFYSGGIERQIHEKTPPSIGARRAELNVASDKPIPEQWAATVAACLAKDLPQRPQSAAEVARRLGLTIPKYGTATPTTQVGAIDSNRPVSVAKRRKTPAVVAAIAALALIGGALGWYFRYYSPKELARKAEESRIAAQRIEAEARSQAEERAANARGAALINTDPPGATVTLGGEAQKSPATFNHVKVGTFPLKVTLENYEPVEKQIEVTEGQIANPGVIKLVRSTGSTQIDTTPDGIEFDLEDAEGKHHTGKTPATLADLPAGSARITYKPEKSAAHSESIIVAAHQSSAFNWNSAAEPQPNTPVPSPNLATTASGRPKPSSTPSEPTKANIPINIKKLLGRFSEHDSWKSPAANLWGDSTQDGVLNVSISSDGKSIIFSGNFAGSTSPSQMFGASQAASFKGSLDAAEIKGGAGNVKVKVHGRFRRTATYSGTFVYKPTGQRSTTYTASSAVLSGDGSSWRLEGNMSNGIETTPIFGLFSREK
jgi:hypothetical protein